jgi:F0F1-type ATP synthase membrane subunit b/b'
MEFTEQDVIVSAVLAIAMVKVFRGPIGAALAERIRGGAPAADDQPLAADVDHLRGRLAEVEERLDFAERLLAQAREADQLHGGAHR